MFVTRYNPNKNMREFRRGFDLLNSILDGYAPRSESNNLGADFTPTINTREGEFSYHLEVDLPGIKKET